MADLPIKHKYYSDVIDAGGLVAAVQNSLDANASQLTATGISESRFPTYARVERGNRFSQVYVAAEERLFLFDIWRDGVMYGNGRTSNIDEMTTAMNDWIANSKTVGEIGQLPCISLVETAHIYDIGGEVDHRWDSYLSNADPYLRELMPFIVLAAQQPSLRQLFPYTSHSTFCFSRCTGYPFSYDCPHVTPADGQFTVGQQAGKILGNGDPEFAVSLVLDNLPVQCGPAIRGTADDLNAR